MRRNAYTPDVFELEERWQGKNPDWYKQYVDEDADDREDSGAEDAAEEPHTAMSPREADDGGEDIPWDNAPVTPKRKGFYGYYGHYFDEYHKIPWNKRRDYAFPFADGTYYAVKPGDVSPVDGKVVTEEDIASLHRDRDCDVYRNNKEKHQESDDYDLLEAIAEEKAKMEKSLPNRFEELKEKLDAYRLVINTGAIVDEFGNDCTDHMMAFMGLPSVEVQLGLGENRLADAFEEAEAKMTEDERQAFTLVHRRGMTRTDAAKELGIAESTVRYRLGKAEKRVKEHPEIARTQQIYRNQYDRIEAWKAAKKARRKRYDENKAKRAAAEKAAKGTTKTTAKKNTDVAGMVKASKNA